MNSVRMGHVMVKIGQRDAHIMHVPFASATPGFGFEALDLVEVFARVGEDHFARPRRLEFFQAMLLDSGSANLEVDFIRYRIRPGIVVFTQPGQVQRLSASRACRGRLLLMEPAFLSAGKNGANPKNIAPLTKCTPAIDSAIRILVEEYSQLTSDERSRSIIFHEAAVLLLRLQRQSELQFPGRGKLPEAHKLFERFEALLDKTFTAHRSTTILASKLSCTEKTLSRACIKIAGLPTKVLIQRRVALEAKRLLAHTNQPVKEISHQLGFTEPTNFVKFFRRVAGEVPSNFRDRVQSGL